MRATNPKARLWWALLPWWGWAWGPHENPDNPAPWYAYPLAALWVVVDRLPGAVFQPVPEIVCTCEECLGVDREAK